MAARQGHADDFVIPLEIPQFNLVGLGVGAYPDYFGSDDSRVGAAHPSRRFSLGGSRFVRLMVNDIRVNVLDHPNWQLGPAALWRFGREDVDNRSSTGFTQSTTPCLSGCSAPTLGTPRSSITPQA